MAWNRISRKLKKNDSKFLQKKRANLIGTELLKKME